MKARTKEEWIAFYEKKTGRKHIPLQNEMCSYHPEHGYLSFLVPPYADPGVFEIHVMIGDGGFWVPLVKESMREAGLTKVQFLTRRNPATWKRKYGARTVAYIMEADIDDIKVWNNKLGTDTEV
jgi:hypothetical protein